MLSKTLLLSGLVIALSEASSSNYRAAVADNKVYYYGDSVKSLESSIKTVPELYIQAKNELFKGDKDNELKTVTKYTYTVDDSLKGVSLLLRVERQNSGATTTVQLNDQEVKAIDEGSDSSKNVRSFLLALKSDGSNTVTIDKNKELGTSKVAPSMNIYTVNNFQPELEKVIVKTGEVTAPTTTVTRDAIVAKLSEEAHKTDDTEVTFSFKPVVQKDSKIVISVPGTYQFTQAKEAGDKAASYKKEGSKTDIAIDFKNAVKLESATYDVVGVESASLIVNLKRADVLNLVNYGIGTKQIVPIFFKSGSSVAPEPLESSQQPSSVASESSENSQQSSSVASESSENSPQSNTAASESSENSTQSSSVAPNSSESSTKPGSNLQGGSNKTTIIVISVFCALAALLVIGGIVYYMYF